MKMRTRVAILIFAVLTLPVESLAATRTVYFSQTGRNIAASSGGVGTASNSVCRITISNPSGSRQTVSIKLQGSSVGTGAGQSGTAPPVDTSSAPVVFLGNSAPQSYSITFPVFNTGSTGTQQIICKGEITVSDPEGPGYIVASGTLTTFTASGTIQTVGTTGNPTPLGGPAVFTQIPVAINRGKPF